MLYCVLACILLCCHGYHCVEGVGGLRTTPTHPWHELTVLTVMMNDEVLPTGCVSPSFLSPRPLPLPPPSPLSHPPFSPHSSSSPPPSSHSSPLPSPPLPLPSSIPQDEVQSVFEQVVLRPQDVWHFTGSVLGEPLQPLEPDVDSEAAPHPKATSGANPPSKGTYVHAYIYYVCGNMVQSLREDPVLQELIHVLPILCSLALQ